MSENYKLIHDLAKKDAVTLEQKGKSYGDSWKRRGGVGAMMMLARKWDRIENIAKDAGWDIFKVAGEDTGGILDDIQDLRCYLLLVEAHVRSELYIKPTAAPRCPPPPPPWGAAPSAPATPVPPTSATVHQQPPALSQCGYCGAVGGHAGFPCPNKKYDDMQRAALNNSALMSNRLVGGRACIDCDKNPCECGKPTRGYVDQD